MNKKTILIVVAVISSLLLIQFFRYEIYISNDGETVMKLDRLTGKVERCRVGC